MLRLRSHSPRRIGSVKHLAASRHTLSRKSKKSNLSPLTQHVYLLKRVSRTRLLKVTALLREEKSFQITSLKMHELYSGETAVIFGDLRVSFYLKSRISLQLCRGFTQSKSMRGFYLNQLFQCIASGDYRAFFLGVKIMENSGLLNIYEKIQVMEMEIAISKHQDKTTQQGGTERLKDDVLSDCLDLLLLISVTSGEPLVAALFAVYAKELTFDVKTKTLERVICALSLRDPLLSNYHSFSIFKILDCYKREYSPKVVLDATRNLTLNLNPFFANLLHDRYRVTYGSLPYVSDSFLETRRALARANITHGNYHRAANFWRLNHSSDSGFSEKNMSLFHFLIEKTSDNALIEDLLLNCFPMSLQTHPDFVHCSLSFFGQRENFRSRFEYLAKSLKPPLKRNILSLLFSSFISQNREVAAEKILQVIFQTKNGINSEDFFIIIVKLLAKQEVKQCVEMCILNDFRVSHKGSMKVMEFLLAHTMLPEEKKLGGHCHDNYDHLKDAFMTKLIKDLYRKTNEKAMYRLFTITLFKHFSRHLNNRAIRKLYQNLSFDINKVENEYANLLSNKVPSEFGKFLVVDNDNRLQCLEIILRQAQAENDAILTNWCAIELQIAGVPVKDIKNFYLGTANNKHVELCLAEGDI